MEIVLKSKLLTYLTHMVIAAFFSASVFAAEKKEKLRTLQLNHLPIEMIDKINFHLPLKEKPKLARTSKEFRHKAFLSLNQIPSDALTATLITLKRTGKFYLFKNFFTTIILPPPPQREANYLTLKKRTTELTDIYTFNINLLNLICDNINGDINTPEYQVFKRYIIMIKGYEARIESSALLLAIVPPIVLIAITRNISDIVLEYQTHFHVSLIIGTNILFSLWRYFIKNPIKYINNKFPCSQIKLIDKILKNDEQRYLTDHTQAEGSSSFKTFIVNNQIVTISEICRLIQNLKSIPSITSEFPD